MKETYYIFKEEDLKRVSGPVQNEWDKPAIFKQELLDICKKVTVNDEKSNNADNFDACSMDVDEAMRTHQEFIKRIDRWLYDLVDGIWYILEVQGAKRPLLGLWDEENDRFVGSGLVGTELDEAIPLKSGKVLWICECPIRKRTEDLESEYHGPFYRSVNEMLKVIGSDNDKKWRFD